MMGLLILFVNNLWGQGTLRPAPFNPSLYQSMKWRNVGPFRGGRCVAVTGVPGNPLVYYMGATGGGVWKTDDGGISWSNITDGYLHVGSVGAIAVAPSDPNVLYVGTGEHAVRGTMTSHGDGVYRSEDGGKTWAHLGLDSSRHIAAIRIHPQNPDIVFVAAQGPVHGAGEERGVFRSLDGGKNWQRVLFVNEFTGATDLSLDWNNPRVLYASMWDHLRTPWEVRSGGEGSGLYKSMDGGQTWEKLTQGLPERMGKAGIDVSRANSSIVYANIEAENGGVFRSDDGGRSWMHVNNSRVTVARAWYYMKITADPRNERGVYVLNAPLLRSIDSGFSFEEVENPHTDQHALWINPDNPQNMILGNDGGACITFNGGRSWSPQDNQPTGQFYRVATDSRFPYNIYGGQQDATAIAVASRTANGAGIGKVNTFEVAGGESAFVALNPQQENLVFGTSYLGNIEVLDLNTGFRKDIMHYPTVGLAELPRDMKYRFNWNAPLITNPQDARVLYHAANVVLRSRDGGYIWQVISPDLTRNETAKQGPGGGPYTNEGAGGENYNTISYLAISPKDGRIIWAGSDDGLIHLSRDEGQTWVNVTPPDLPEAIINCIEASPHSAGAAYVTAMRYKFNDFSPIVYHTTDYGQNWARVVRGFAPEDFVRVVREDPKRSGLLYAGTETGLYISTDRGKFWRRFQLNLPVCPITDLVIKDNDLVASTAGRGFWVLDDISAIQETASRDLTAEAHLVRPKPVVRFPMKLEKPSLVAGQNPLPGVIIDYSLPVNYDSIEVKLVILDENNITIRRFSNKPQADYQRYEGSPAIPPRLTSNAGFNRFYWDLRRDPIMHVPGLFVLGDYASGMVAPGNYTCRLSIGNRKLEQTIRVLPDPRLPEVEATQYAEQQRILLNIEAAVVEIHQSLKTLRQVRSQMENITKQLEYIGQPDMINRGTAIINHINDWESKVAQPRQKTYQDAINYPNRLNAAFLDLHERIDTHDPRVTQGARTRFQELQDQWARLQIERNDILTKEIQAFNDLYVERQLPPLILPKADNESNAW